jgi:hypothetical protein
MREVTKLGACTDALQVEGLAQPTARAIHKMSKMCIMSLIEARKVKRACSCSSGRAICELQETSFELQAFQKLLKKQFETLCTTANSAVFQRSRSILVTKINNNFNGLG